MTNPTPTRPEPTTPRKMSLSPLASGFVSQGVIVLTVDEYNKRINDAWLSGVERGKFEQHSSGWTSRAQRGAIEDDADNGSRPLPTNSGSAP